jgi:uncharacterized protein YcfL
MGVHTSSRKHKMSRTGVLLLSLSAVALFAGTMTNALADNAPSIASKLEEQGRIDNLKVTDLRASKHNNLLKIQAEVTNTSASNQQLYYRFKWLDNDGFVVWDEEPWKPVMIYGRQKQIISVGSPTFKATDFRLILQSPN